MIRLQITPGHVNDRTPVRDLLKGIKAKVIGDKGYLSQALFDDLFDQEVTLIIKIKKKMKNKLMSLKDKAMLQKRGFIETIFSSLKSLGTLIHHRHRCPINALAYLLAALINYQLRHNKPFLHP
ncbi:MAG: transposase [Janthinobacterium lividum]